jgi:hypothetical protein
MNIITPQDRGLKFFKKPEERAYVFQPYPSVRYHRDGRSMTVKSEDEDLALGKDWAATPFPPVPKPAPAAEPTKMELLAKLNHLTELYGELKAYTTDVQNANIELRTQLAKLKAHPEAAALAPDAESETPAADEAHKGNKKRKEK